MKWYTDWNWWAVHRPHSMFYWVTDRRFGIEVSWGNGNSDPVWSIGVEITLPGWWPGA